MKLSNTNAFVLFVIAAVTLWPSSIFAAERPSDHTIEYLVRDSLVADPYVNAAEINIQVSEGIVTLSGIVENLTAKKYADQEAKKLRGVLGVINQIVVMPAFCCDTDIAQDVRHRIVNNAAIESESINVTSNNGVVELRGQVRSWSEREEAGLLATKVRGVRDVENFLAVVQETNRPDDGIAKDVAATLRRDVYLNSLPIGVSVTDGVITLTGTVSSEYEKMRAAGDVRWIENVRGISNKIEVTWLDLEGTRTQFPFPTDAQLHEAVTDELSQDSRLALRDLKVSTEGGHVTLEGSVAHEYQRKLAGADARDVVGVAWVTNHLSVRSVRRDDLKIHNDILHDMATDSALWNQNITVKVGDGTVTLSGKVATGGDKLHAEKLVSRIRGVRCVINDIQVNWKQEYADAELFKRVWDRIRANWLLSPVQDRIKIHVRKGVLTLTGTVYNWGERHEAEQVAVHTEGIRMVDDRLHVEGYDYDYENWHLAHPDNATRLGGDIDPYKF